VVIPPGWVRLRLPGILLSGPLYTHVSRAFSENHGSSVVFMVAISSEKGRFAFGRGRGW